MTTTTLNNNLVVRHPGIAGKTGGFLRALRDAAGLVLGSVLPRANALSREVRTDPTIAPMQDVNATLIMMDVARNRAAIDATARRRHS